MKRKLLSNSKKHGAIKAFIVKASELGTQCWKPIRFIERCYECDLYFRCTLNVKVKNLAYEELYSIIKHRIKDLKEVKKALMDWLDKQRINDDRMDHIEKGAHLGRSKGA